MFDARARASASAAKAHHPFGLIVLNASQTSPAPRTQPFHTSLPYHLITIVSVTLNGWLLWHMPIPNISNCASTTHSLSACPPVPKAATKPAKHIHIPSGSQWYALSVLSSCSVINILQLSPVIKTATSFRQMLLLLSARSSKIGHPGKIDQVLSFVSSSLRRQTPPPATSTSSSASYLQNVPFKQTAWRPRTVSSRTPRRCTTSLILQTMGISNGAGSAYGTMGPLVQRILHGCMPSTIFITSTLWTYSVISLPTPDLKDHGTTSLTKSMLVMMFGCSRT